MDKKTVDNLTRESPLSIPVILKAHYSSVPKEPAHFISEPSTVKSVSVYNFAVSTAEQEGRSFVDWNRTTALQKEEVMRSPEKFFVFADIRASETDIGEMRLQEMNNGKSFITYKYNILFIALSHKDAKGILFFDEMNLAPNMIKAQFYKIINDHCIGDIPISTGVMCVSAGNEAEHARGVTEDPVPLVLRRGNYFLRPLSADEYVDYAVIVGQHPWITGYLKFESHNVHKIDYDSHIGAGQPCPRTWTKLSNIMLSNKNLSDAELGMIARGLVGQATAIKFMSYCKMARKVEIEDILKHPEKMEDFREDASMTYAILAAGLEKLRTDKKRSEDLFSLTLHMREEFAAFTLKQIKNVLGQAAMSRAVGESKVFKEVAGRYQKYFLE